MPEGLAVDGALRDRQAGFTATVVPWQNTNELTCDKMGKG